MFLKLINKVFGALHITTEPVIKAYDGYADEDDVLIYGHVFRFSPVARKRFRNNIPVNLFAMLRLFIVRTRRFAIVRVELEGEVVETTTDSEGFFKFEWKARQKLKPGWHKATLSYIGKKTFQVRAKTHCMVFVPHRSQYNFISDIDDTFLISHTRNIFKRLYVLFTHNARSRRPFEGVANHYRLLAVSNAAEGIPNPFFYVSNSEWNLYDEIKEFCSKQQMPRGIFLLNKLKRLRWIFSLTRTKYEGKYMRIARIMKLFPHHRYVLLGDNSQKDPHIYHSIIRDFPGKVFAVYLRRINSSKEISAAQFVEKIKAAGVHCCYFEHSIEAIEHSKSIGLINPQYQPGDFKKPKEKSVAG